MARGRGRGRHEITRGGGRHEIGKGRGSQNGNDTNVGTNGHIGEQTATTTSHSASNLEPNGAPETGPNLPTLYPNGKT